MSFHIPDKALLNSRTYYSGGSTNWQIWNKPKNINKVHFFCIGGGGAGGGGQQSGSNQLTGGGGGAGSTILQSVYQSFLLPDILYVRVGSGGIGSSIAGTAGGISYVSVYPNILSSNLVAISGTSAGGGTNGSAGGAGGIIGTEASPSIAAFLSMSEFTTFPGIAGTAGSITGTTPSNIIGLTNSILTGGAGGGGAGFLSGSEVPGASITANGLSPLIAGGTVVIGGSSRPGGNGITYNIPFFSTGGAGGGASYGSAAAIGGAGGRAGIGSGGGGGGGGGGTAGIGGNGGNGIIIIYCT